MKQPRSRQRELVAATTAVVGLAGVLGLLASLVMQADYLAAADGSPRWLVGLAAVVVAAGSSWWASRTTPGFVEWGLVPFGMLKLAVFLLLWLWAPPGAALWVAALAAGIVAAIIAGSVTPPVQEMTRYQGLVGPILGVVAATAAITAGWWGGSAYLTAAGAPNTLVWMTAGVGLLFALAVLLLLGDYAFRFVLVRSAKFAYRIDVRGLENIPREGPAVIVSNHVSYADGNLYTSVIPRFVRFVVWHGHYNNRWLRFFGHLMHAIPINPQAPPRELLRQLRTINEHLDQGELVFVFPEGGLTRLGVNLPFHRGIEAVMKHSPDVPIIPAYIDGMWGSIFSFAGGRFFHKWPTKIPYRLRIHFGKPLPANTPTVAIREQVLLTGVEAFTERKKVRRPLHRTFVRTARRHPRRACMTDARTPTLSFRKALLGAIVLKRVLKRKLGPAPRVGLFVPPSVGAALANVAVSFLGKIPINLNYTVGQDTLDQCSEMAKIEQVVTSKMFLQKVPLKPKGDLLFLEDLRKEATLVDKLVALACCLLPGFLAERLICDGPVESMDDLATIIFSSGSTGTPKGVMLSHFNILSNCEAVIQVGDLGPWDRLMGVLPIFHSFGYTVTLWMPLTQGIPVIYHYTPLEADVVGKLIREHQATFFVSTATFLRNHLRKSGEDDLRSLRFLVCGAEKLPMPLADQVENKFGVRPLEGYGCTEVSPVVSCNRPDFPATGSVPPQTGNKFGTIGHAIPGVVVRVLDPETLEPLPLGQEGVIAVRGPNVMLGYLDRPYLTAESVRDGWYLTGDIARMDEDGFITITDRASRFSKIGGEMVPHGRVEEAIHAVLESTERTCVVVGIPDERKGERLVVLHTRLEVEVKQVWQRLRESGLPPLWLPSPGAFHEIDEMPVLGSGKLDLKGVKELARGLTGNSVSA